MNAGRDEQFVESLCDGFTRALNAHAGRCLYCNQDAFEVLQAVFGEGFSEAQVRAATAEHLEQLAAKVRSYLELESVTPEAVKTALEAGLWQAG